MKTRMTGFLLLLIFLGLPVGLMVYHFGFIILLGPLLAFGFLFMIFVLPVILTEAVDMLFKGD